MSLCWAALQNKQYCSFCLKSGLFLAKAWQWEWPPQDTKGKRNQKQYLLTVHKGKACGNNSTGSEWWFGSSSPCVDHVSSRYTRKKKGPETNKRQRGYSKSSVTCPCKNSILLKLFFKIVFSWICVAYIITQSVFSLDNNLQQGAPTQPSETRV